MQQVQTMCGVLIIALSAVTFAVACSGPAAPTAAPGATPAPRATEPPKAAAQPKPPATPQGRLVIALQGIHPTLEPLTLGAPTRVHTHAIFDTLTYINEKGVLAPRLAREWKLLDDRLTWEFKLIPGLRYHDGEPVDAASVKWSFDYVMTPQNRSPLAARAASIAEVTAQDATTLHIKTRQPSPILPRDVESFPISSAKFATSTDPVGANWRDKAAGSGAFKVREFRPDVSVTLIPSGDPTPQTPDGARVAELVYRVIPESSTRVAALRNREVDIVYQPEVDQARALAREGNKLISVPIGQTLGFTGNILHDGPSQNPLVRRAAFMAVNVKEMVDGIYGDVTKPAYQLAVDSADGFDPGFQPAYRYDRTAAKQLLTQAGYPNGFSAKMHVLASNPQFAAIGTAVSGYVEEIGIKLEIEQMDGPRYTELFTRGGMHPWYVNTWTHATLDLDAALNWFLSDITTAPVRFRNPRFDTALKASKVELDPARRTQLLRDAQRILLTDDPVTMPLVYNPYFWVTLPKVENLKVLPSSKLDVTGLFTTQP